MATAMDTTSPSPSSPSASHAGAGAANASTPTPQVNVRVAYSGGGPPEIRPERNPTEPFTSPWLPLTAHVKPYLLYQYKAPTLAAVDPLRGFHSVHSVARHLRVSWEVEVNASWRDLELLQRQRDEPVNGKNGKNGKNEKENATSDEEAFVRMTALSYKSVRVIANQTDSGFRAALDAIEAEGYDPERVHPLYLGLVSGKSTLPKPIKYSFIAHTRTAPGPTPDAAVPNGHVDRDTGFYWTAMSTGALGSLEPHAEVGGSRGLGQGTEEKVESGPLMFPLPMSPVPGHPALYMTQDYKPKTRKNKKPVATTIMQASAEVASHYQHLGALTEKQLANACVVLPPHPDPNYNGPEVPLEEQFVLAPPNHVIALCAQALDSERTYKVVISQPSVASALGSGQTAPRELLAIPKDVVTRAVYDLKHGAMSSVRSRELSLRSIGIALNPTESPTFGSTEMTEEEWERPGTISLHFEMYVVAYPKGFTTDPTVVPLVGAQI